MMESKEDFEDDEDDDEEGLEDDEDDPESFEELVQKTHEAQEMERKLINTLGVGDVRIFDSQGRLIREESMTIFEVSIEKGLPLPPGVDRAFWEARLARRKAEAQTRAAKLPRLRLSRDGMTLSPEEDNG